MRTTYSDISVMPWYNNLTMTNLYWSGRIAGTILDESTLSTYGPQSLLVPLKYQLIAFRYYKKLDWMLGVIGGGMFLMFLILWVPCSYISRSMSKIERVRKVMLELEE